MKATARIMKVVCFAQQYLFKIESNLLMERVTSGFIK
jgi:hypothetical protein